MRRRRTNGLIPEARRPITTGMNTRFIGLAAALGATMLWGGNFVVARGLADQISPFRLNFWRWLIALVCVLPLSLPKLRADWPAMRNHWRYLALMSFAGITVLNPFIYVAGQTTGSLNMALLLPTAPIMILILARVLQAEPLTPRRLIGAVVVLIGVVSLISHGDWHQLTHVHFSVGDLWALAGAAAFAIYSFFARLRPKDLSVEGFNAATFALGLLLSLPALAWEEAVLPAPRLNTAVIVGVLYSGIGCSFAAYLLWIKAIANVGPVMAGMVYYCVPLFTAVESAIVLGERIAPYHVGSGLGIIGGIVLATLPQRPPRLVGGKRRGGGARGETL